MAKRRMDRARRAEAGLTELVARRRGVAASSPEGGGSAATTTNSGSCRERRER
jgi:hypothetical protein